MNKKEKAKELVEKFYEWRAYFDHKTGKVVAKQCALIAVDEIIKCLLNVTVKFESQFPTSYVVTYNELSLKEWQGVKEEIKQL